MSQGFRDRLCTNQSASRYPTSSASWKKSSEVTQTAELPPKSGRSRRAASGSARKSRKAPSATVTA